MRKSVSACALALCAFAFGSVADAALVYMGTSLGDLAVHYNNNGGGENPGNQSYITSEFSSTNSNGALFNFDPTLGGAPGYGPLHPFQAVPAQFGFDLNYITPTWDNTTPVGAPIQTYDNGDNSLGGAIPGPQTAFAFSGYVGSTTAGPADPANGIINSILRGNGVNFTVTNLTQLGTVFTVSVEGTLTTDGFFHWYTIGTPDSTLAAAGLQDDIFFQGTFSYDSATDSSTNLIDRYTGTADFYFQTLEPVVPEPATLSLLGLGLTGLGVMRKRRRKA